MGRAPCCSKVGLHRGPWTTREDTLLVSYIQVHGEGSWRNMPKEAGLLRCGKSCRLRWLNYLRPDIKRGNITSDEDDLILRLHSLLGNRWSLIAGRLPGRTDNEIKNYWNSHLGKKLKTTTTTTSPTTITNKVARKHLKGKRKRALDINKAMSSISSQGHEKIDDMDVGVVTMMDSSTKIHVPKPVRPKAFVIVRNQSFDSLASGSSSSCVDEGDIHKDQEDHTTTTTLDNRSRVFDDLPPWSSHFAIDCDDHDRDDTNEELAYISCQSSPNNVMLDQLYEEYQQLLKVEDDAHVDAFVESLL